MRRAYLCGLGLAPVLIAEDRFPLKAFTAQDDPLYVRVISLQADEKHIFVSIDMTSLPSHMIDRIRQQASKICGCEEGHVQVSVTHSFSSPHIPPAIKNDTDCHVSEVMTSALTRALDEALRRAESMDETEFRYGEAVCGLNVNRNVETEAGWWTGQDPDGFADHKVRVLSLVQKGKIRAALVNYDLQASLMDKVVMKDGGLHISADLTGEAARILKEQDIMMIFTPGAAADQAPFMKKEYPKDESRYELVREYGRQLADAVSRACADSESIDMEKGIQLKQIQISLPAQKMLIPTKELTPHRTFTFIKDENDIRTDITLLTIGSLSILMCAPELNSSFGSEIRACADGACMIMTLVNGAVKYLPQKEDYERITYTAMNTVIAEGADRIFLRAAKQLLGGKKGE